MPEPVQNTEGAPSSASYVNPNMPHGDNIWQRMRSSKLLKIGLPLLLVALLPLMVFMAGQQQEDRSRASAASILSFLPGTTTQSPTTVQEGTPVEFAVMLDPGSNLVSFVNLVIEYDKTYLAVEKDAFVANTATFQGSPQPVYSDGKIQQTLQFPQGSTTGVQKQTEIGKLRLKTIKPTEKIKPTMIRFGTETTVTSIGANDTFNENVLSSTQPAFVQINSGPTNVVGTTITPLVTGNITVTVSPQPICTPTTADLNKDGRVDNADHTIIANCYKKSTTLTQCTTADINKDGSIDVLDLNCVLRGGQ